MAGTALLVILLLWTQSCAHAECAKSTPTAQLQAARTNSFAIAAASHGLTQPAPQAAASDAFGRSKRRNSRRKRPRGRRRSSSGGSGKYTYFGFDGQWRSHSNLTYALSPTDVTALVPRRDILFALESAFRTWATVVPLTFTRLDDAALWEWADIKVSFLGGEHGDGQPFDGTLGVLGHSFAPEDGRMHLDVAEQWSVDVTAEWCRHVPATMDLQSVVLHEAGHLIGLGHSADPAAAMFADIAPHQVKHSLSADDIQGAQSLYGSSQVYKVRQAGQGTNFAPSQGPSSGIGEVARGAWKWHLFFLLAAACLVD